MIYKGPAKSVLPQESESTSGRGEPEPLTPTQESGLQPSRALNGGTRSDEEITEGKPNLYYSIKTKEPYTGLCYTILESSTMLFPLFLTIILTVYVYSDIVYRHL